MLLPRPASYSISLHQSVTAWAFVPTLSVSYPCSHIKKQIPAFSDGAEGMIYDNDRAGHESWAGTSHCRIALVQWLPVAHVIYSSKPVKKKRIKSITSKKDSIYAISNTNTASVVLTIMFPLMLLKNIKSHYLCSKMQTRDCVTTSVSKFILPFGHNNVVSAITHLFNLLHPSCYLKCLMSSGSDSVFFQSQWTFLNTTVSPPPLKVCVSSFIWHLCFFLYHILN